MQLKIGHTHGEGADVERACNVTQEDVNQLVAARNEVAAMVEEIHGTVREPRNKTAELIIVASVSDGGGVVTMG